MSIVSKKLLNLKTIFRGWNKNIFCVVHVNVQISNSVLDVMHEQIDIHGYNYALMK